MKLDQQQLTALHQRTPGLAGVPPSREYFNKLSIETQSSPSMYTSVHYVIGSGSRTQVTCEIQVRTLMEEVWGEVDHTINYPHASSSLSCREQLKVLARVTSSATRLVDAIFATSHEHSSQAVDQPQAKSPAPSAQKVSGRPKRRAR